MGGRGTDVFFFWGGGSVHCSHRYEHKLQNRAIKNRFRGLRGLIGTHTAINHFIRPSVVYSLVYKSASLVHITTVQQG